MTMMTRDCFAGAFTMAWTYLDDDVSDLLQQDWAGQRENRGVRSVTGGSPCPRPLRRDTS
eukprot:1602319-Rhodomonas_salina.2